MPETHDAQVYKSMQEPLVSLGGVFDHGYDVTLTKNKIHITKNAKRNLSDTVCTGDRLKN